MIALSLIGTTQQLTKVINQGAVGSRQEKKDALKLVVQKSGVSSAVLRGKNQNSKKNHKFHAS